MAEKNPFSKKNSELFSDVQTFLRFFSPIILDRLKEKLDRQLLSNTIFFRSPPGFGKSTIFRLFSAAVLKNLQVQKSQSQDFCRDTIKSLDEFDVFGVSYPKLLGINLNVADGFSEISEVFGIESLPIFRALVNAKVILMLVAALRDFYGLSFDDDLKDFQLHLKNDISWGALPKTDSLQQLYEWAENTEHQIVKGISDLHIADKKSLLHAEYTSIKFLGKVSITYQSEQHIQKFLLMIDDVHNLDSSQRSDLLQSLSKLRNPYPVWIAERLSSLSAEETLIEGADEGRDYCVVPLDVLEGAKQRNHFNKFADSIIQSRIESSSLTSFVSWLLVNNIDLSGPAKEALKVLKPRFEECLQYGGFKSWSKLDVSEMSNLEPYKVVIEIQSYFSAIAKYQNKGYGRPLFEESLEKMPPTDLSFIKYYIYKQYGIPYYCGQDIIKKLSGNSVFELLQIAEAFFEEIFRLSLMTSANKTHITPQRQQKIIKKLGQQKFEKINSMVRNAQKAKNLLINFSKLALQRSLKESGPYTPSITGFAITRDELIKVINDDNLVQLREILADLRKNNFVSIIQMNRNEENLTIFYLNRLLCVYFDLAYGFGGWQKLSVEFLSDLSRQTAKPGKEISDAFIQQGDLFGEG